MSVLRECLSVSMRVSVCLSVWVSEWVSEWVSKWVCLSVCLSVCRCEWTNEWSRCHTILWRIQDFTEGAPTLTLQMGTNLLFGNMFAENCMKTKEIWPRRGHAPRATWIRHYKQYKFPTNIIKRRAAYSQIQSPSTLTHGLGKAFY